MSTPAKSAARKPAAVATAVAAAAVHDITPPTEAEFAAMDVDTKLVAVFEVILAVFGMLKNNSKPSRVGAANASPSKSRTTTSAEKFPARCRLETIMVTFLLALFNRHPNNFAEVARLFKEFARRLSDNLSARCGIPMTDYTVYDAKVDEVIEAIRTTEKLGKRELTKHITEIVNTWVAANTAVGTYIMDIHKQDLKDLGFSDKPAEMSVIRSSVFKCGQGTHRLNGVPTSTHPRFEIVEIEAGASAAPAARAAVDTPAPAAAKSRAATTPRVVVPAAPTPARDFVDPTEETIDVLEGQH
jgi:hypothetical protein